MQIPNSLSHSSALVGEVRPRVEGPAQAGAREDQSPAVKLELSALARRSSFPPASDLKELAAGLEPKHRALQLAAALDGPGVPVALKLATLKMMLAEATAPLPDATQSELVATSRIASQQAKDSGQSERDPTSTRSDDPASTADTGPKSVPNAVPFDAKASLDAPASTSTAHAAGAGPSPPQHVFKSEA